VSWSIGYHCDGHLNGKSCRTGTTLYTDITPGAVEAAVVKSRSEGFRPLSDVLSPKTHLQVPGELLCRRTDHDEEQPGYGPEDWVRLTPALVKPGDTWGDI
jgi:hypothetical protein